VCVMDPLLQRKTSRRRFLVAAAVSATGATLRGSNISAAQSSQPSPLPQLCLFSKPLHNRSFTELPAILAELGMNAVDLTCRPGGHVLPERVADDLPRAFEIMKRAGITVPMITTGITDAGKGNAEVILKTASALGIRYAKLGYYPYGDLRRIPAILADVRARLTDVVSLCERHNVRAGFHNHSGLNVGSPIWDQWHLISTLPTDWIGSYFDPAHATVEGGDAGWRISLNLLAPRITMLAVKDFVWIRGDKSGWKPSWCRLGEGMVRWSEVLRHLKDQRFAGPISLDIEYGDKGPPGSEADKVRRDSIRHDFTVLREWLQQASLA
jgi:L-ribulose-5-phosphate 3-epimerase